MAPTRCACCFSTKPFLVPWARSAGTILVNVASHARVEAGAVSESSVVLRACDCVGSIRYKVAATEATLALSAKA
eukprot:4433873-Pleurochrysis_carterae.AAC.1